MKTNNTNTNTNTTTDNGVLKSFQTAGNRKLLDYIDTETGKAYKYAQYNTRPCVDCPFKSAGCAAACYAAHGLHNMPTVKAARQRSYEDSLRADFSARMIETIEHYLNTRRYIGSTMIVRIHEAGDFYNQVYLNKWVDVWQHFKDNKNVVFCFYTKSFNFFIDLDNEQKNVVNECMRNGVLAGSLSLDDTTTKEQLDRARLLRCLFPLFNVYYMSDNIEAVKYDNICECKNCAKCGLCTHARGKLTVCKIHSVSEKQLKIYDSKKRAI